tara:strand:- start:9771 stop:10922 length:1152 start_codon:yes stop_codon:yes gene_type:complete
MNKKRIIELIKKMGTDDLEMPPDPPGVVAKKTPKNTLPDSNSEMPSDPPGSAKPSSPASKPTVRPASYGLAAVKEMQQAILDFVGVAASTDVTSMTGNQHGQQYGQQTRAIPGQPVAGQGESKDDKEYLGGSDPFGNFLVQHYVKGDPVGQQYLNVDVSGNKARSDASIENLNIRGILDTIKRIGTPGAEKAVDGIWQVRTNNALKNIFALTSGMLKFAQAMKLQVNGYTEDALKDFKSKIPESYTNLKTPNDVAEAAKQITPHIKAITKFFESLKTAVFEQPELRKFIDQKAAFVSYKKKIEIPEGIKHAILPNVKFNWIKDPSQNYMLLSDLSSLEEFKRFLERTGVSTLNADTNSIKQVLELVSKQLNNTVYNKSNESGY